jgi:predicted exporter
VRLPFGPKARSVVVFGAVAALFAIVVTRVRIDMSIAHFLPEGHDPRLAGLLRTLAESETASTIVVDVMGGDEDARVATARALVGKLGARPGIKSVRSAMDEARERELFERLASYPPSALLPKSAFTDDAIAERVAALKRELAGPMGPAVRLTAARDPLGAELGLLRVLRAELGGATMTRDGVLLSEDGVHAFVLVTPDGNALDADVQRASLAEIARAFEAGSATPDVHYELSGVGRFTIDSEQHIRGDIERIGTVSTIGILALFAVMFRSLRMLALGLVPLLFGSMIAMIGAYVIFGRVHGLTVAFGSSLLGVGIDYAEHYYAHFALEPDVGALAMMRRVWPGLLLGALTTIVGLAGLAWADFPGAIQMAVFSSLAVAGALIGTRLLLPAWMPPRYVRPPLPARLEAAAARLLGALVCYRRWPWVPIAVTAACAIGLLRVRFVDDLNLLVDSNPAIVAEDARVRERLTKMDQGRFAVVLGADDETALDALGAAEAELQAAEHDGVIAHHLPLGALLRSRRAQRESLEAAKASLPALDRALEGQGFRVEAFAPYRGALAQGAERVLTLDDVVSSPMGAVVRPLAPRVGTQRAFVVPVGGVRSIAELGARVPHAIVVDESALLAQTYAHVRSRLLSLVALGLVFVFALLLLRYKSARISLAAMLPAVLAAAFTTACFGWAGTPLTILHAIGLALVLSMGVDYGIFVVEGRASREDAARSLVSVLTATVTTILSFGVLAISTTPALRALGLAISIGMTLSFVLCPSALVLLLLREKAR